MVPGVTPRIVPCGRVYTMGWPLPGNEPLDVSGVAMELLILLMFEESRT
jgi:hypothetical protein